MAYMTADGKGPYPNKAGEYCGNYHQYDRSLQNTHKRGRPHACKVSTIKEMEAVGWFGLYLKEDEKVLLPGATEIPTPPELMEPDVTSLDLNKRVSESRDQLLKTSLEHKEMKKFKLYWLDGKTKKVEGVDAADAMRRAGIGAGALRALDYWEEIATDDELNQLAMDDIVNAMRMKGVRKIEIYTTKSGKKSSDPFVAEIVEWHGDVTFARHLLDGNDTRINQDVPTECECDNTHQANDTVCRWCWSRGRRKWNDPNVA